VSEPIDPLDTARAIARHLLPPFSAPLELRNGGPPFVREQLNRLIGKTIAKLDFGPTKADPVDPKDVDSEFLTLHFSDGTALRIEIALASLGTSFIVGWPGDE
jgi:hypothetical protein